MELKTIQHLCNLSRLSYEDEGLQKVMAEMTDIISLMDGIKEFDLCYDDTKDNNSISFSELREDIAKPSFYSEKLMQNTKSREGCYVVPKVVE